MAVTIPSSILCQSEHLEMLRKGFQVGSIAVKLHRSTMCYEVNYSKERPISERIGLVVDAIVGSLWCSCFSSDDVKNTFTAAIEDSHSVRKYFKSFKKDKLAREQDSQLLGFDSSDATSIRDYLRDCNPERTVSNGHAFIAVIKPSGTSGFIFLPHKQVQ